MHGSGAVLGPEVEDGAPVDEGHDHPAGPGPDPRNQRQWSLCNKYRIQNAWYLLFCSADWNLQSLSVEFLCGPFLLPVHFDMVSQSLTVWAVRPRIRLFHSTEFSGSSGREIISQLMLGTSGLTLLSRETIPNKSACDEFNLTKTNSQAADE